ncbi:hypothetical protein LOH54_08245 [Sulfurimonas sp. HSL-3221]|uniref:hypothetical protein n=1 Tax=Sulfurimonadaceae TaxID=2771471 RepID=UPI001E3F8038|nr:hypothetical protein [Sulfurimonas sp. HSL-3221]UFS61652.1 hypothetical protein LOH54_08245 [Sulfurimonas sp. HSL-3221]
MNFDKNRLAEIAAALSPFEIDCAITVALKISDDTCKMGTGQRALFMALYDLVPDKSSAMFTEDVHALILQGRSALSDEIAAAIKPLRESAMDAITRPKMKAFKASIRARLSADEAA